jgi:hypothetical protein
MRSGDEIRVGGYINYFLQTESHIIYSHNSQARVMASLLSLLTVLTVAQPPITTPYEPPPLLPSPFMPTTPPLLPSPLMPTTPPLLPSPLMPTTPSTHPGVLMSAMITPQTLGAYIIEIEVDTPPVNQLMIIDTGSNVTWFQCKPCNCYLTPGIFDPLVSTSILAMPCDSTTCNYLD